MNKVATLKENNMKEFNLEQCFDEDNGRAIWHTPSHDYDIYLSTVPCPGRPNHFLGFIIESNSTGWFHTTQLKNIPRKRQGWINLYKSDLSRYYINADRSIYNSKENALYVRSMDLEYHGDPVMIYEVEE
jgi:hypothetical protein